MSIDQVSNSVIAALPLGRLLVALQDTGAYLVGGVTRAMFGAEPLPGGDIDIAIDADLSPIAERLAAQGFEVQVHERFGTATIAGQAGIAVDLARTRRERYERSGALPTVRAAPISQDLGRRDFTVNAIAVALDPPHRVLDPFGGREDLARGRLRVLHDRSFVDDPSRAIRAARYSARLGLRPAPETVELIAASDLPSIGADRLDAELRRLAGEPDPAAGFSLLAEWGVLEPVDDAPRLIEAVGAERAAADWELLPERATVDAVLIAADQGPAGSRERALSLVGFEPPSLSAGEPRASRLSEAELLVATAAGAGWVRDYVSRRREVAAAIDGDDLIAAGVPAGPAIGRGLAEVRRQLLDQVIGDSRDEQLQVALRAAAAPE